MSDQDTQFETFAIVTDTVTHNRTLTESNVETRYDRSRFFSQDVDVDDVDENLCFLYALPVTDHESYRPNNIVAGREQETCRQWKMVYRYMPTERTQAMKADRLAMVAR